MPAPVCSTVFPGSYCVVITGYATPGDRPDREAKFPRRVNTRNFFFSTLITPIPMNDSNIPKCALFVSLVIRAQDQTEYIYKNYLLPGMKCHIKTWCIMHPCDRELQFGPLSVLERQDEIENRVWQDLLREAVLIRRSQSQTQLSYFLFFRFIFDEPLLSFSRDQWYCGPKLFGISCIGKASKIKLKM